MLRKCTRPLVKEVAIHDEFWTPYINRFRRISIPHMLKNFEKDGYLAHFSEVARGESGTHNGVPFSDGLFFETIRGISDFIAVQYDKELDLTLDRYIEEITSASEKSPDGFLCTKTSLMYPDKKYGENGGDIVIQHDLYDMGCLVEAAISHYNATGKTSLLRCAVRAANGICDHIGPAPKHHIMPGHSLPEEAFIKLYRLFRENKQLDAFAKEHNVNFEEYLRVAKFWYDGRGVEKNSLLFESYYNQNHAPLTAQKTAEGHCVRAALCYLGAASVALETNDSDYAKALGTLWDNAILKRMHISGGIGSRHEIEGFSTDYDLPNDAYLETCAGIALSFWNGEMSLMCPDGKYFDSFELSLYNNILGAVSDDGTHFTYTNALIDGAARGRWHWHGCPCCPPMLSKLLSSLGTYIYSVGVNNELYVNMFIDSTLETGDIKVTQNKKCISIDSNGKLLSLRIRIPCYAKNFSVCLNGKQTELHVKDGYALIERIWNAKDTVEVCFDTAITRVCAHRNIIADAGLVAVMKGPVLYCAEGIDNDGVTDFTFPKAVEFEPIENLPANVSKLEGYVPPEPDENPETTPDNTRLAPGSLKSKDILGRDITLVPYYRRNNRGLSIMRVWFKQEGLTEDKQPVGKIPYGVYND